MNLITNSRKDFPRVYVGIDGLGYFDTEQQRYIHDLIAVSNLTIGSPGVRLTSSVVFNLIRKAAETYRARGLEPIFQTYFSQLQITNWLKDLDTMTRGLLAKRGGGRTTKSGSWGIKYLADHWLELSWKLEDGSTDRVRVYDAGQTFGTSFSETAGTLLELSEYDRTQLLKVEAKAPEQTYAERAQEFDGLRHSLTRSTQITAKTLSKFYRTISPLFEHELDIELHGPGKLAEQFLAMTARNELDWDGDESLLLTNREQIELLGPDIYEMANAAYYGGIFETLAHGRIDGPVYQYDLNSAYPAAIAQLPSLRGATVRTTEDRDEALQALADGAIVLASVDFVATQKLIGALPVRHRGKEQEDGSSNEVSYRPGLGITQVPLQEVLDAEANGLLEKWGLIEAAIIEVDRELPKPFAHVAALYNRRLEAGKKSPLGLAIKLILNSLYGKMAQGFSYDYASPVYAALISSAVRSEIYRAIGTHPHGVAGLIRVETDAVFFFTEHPTLPLSDRLGEWDLTQYDGGIWSIGPGLWASMVRDESDGERERWMTDTLKTRGFTQEAFYRAWEPKILPLLEFFEDAKKWNTRAEIGIDESHLWLSLTEAARTSRLDQAGDYLTDSTGSPTTERPLRLSVGSRYEPQWDEAMGCFISEVAQFGPQIPVAVERGKMIGGDRARELLELLRKQEEPEELETFEEGDEWDESDEFFG